MTQQKNEPKKAKKGIKPAQIQPSVNLRQKFSALSQHDQSAVVTFFNLHNAAMFVYNNLSKDAQEYCEYCISVSQEDQKDDKSV